jgi:hypothetical protein
MLTPDLDNEIYYLYLSRNHTGEAQKVKLQCTS